MNAVTFGQCVKGAWRDGWRYAKKQPVLLLVIFILAWLAFPAEVALRPTSVPPFHLIAYLPFSLFEMARAAVFSILAVQSTRFVLLGESAIRGPLFGGNFWRYLGITFGLGFALLIVMSGSVILMGLLTRVLARHQFVTPLLVPLIFAAGILIAAWLGFFVYIRLSLLCTHVAIGHAMQVRDAWADTRGHCWSIGLTQTVVTVPLMLLTGILGTTYVAARLHGWGGAAAAIEAVVQVATLCISAACSAWLYRRYAGTLLTRSTP